MDVTNYNKTIRNRMSFGNNSLSTSTSHIILKSLEHVFKLAGLALIGSGAVIGINDMTSSIIKLLSSIFSKYDKDKKNEEKNDNNNIINITWSDTYTTLGKMARSCFSIATVVLH